jgi:hypothetical protein
MDGRWRSKGSTYTSLERHSQFIHIFRSPHIPSPPHRHLSRILARSNICIIEWAAGIVSLLPARFLAVNKAVD